MNLGLQLRDKLMKANPKRARGKALILDTSMSMSGEPIIKLRALASRFRVLTRIQFSSMAEVLASTSEVGDASGSTNMAAAFRLLKNLGLKSAVMITDGEPDSARDALDEAVGLKIDVIYVGHRDPPPDFLKDLAEATRGKFKKDSLDDTMLIENTVAGLLSSGEE